VNRLQKINEKQVAGENVIRKDHNLYSSFGINREFKRGKVRHVARTEKMIYATSFWWGILNA